MLRYRTLVHSPLKYAEPAPRDGPGLWGVVSYLNLEPLRTLHVSEFNKGFYTFVIDGNGTIATLPRHVASTAIEIESVPRSRVLVRKNRAFIAWLKPLPVYRATRSWQKPALKKEPDHIWKRRDVLDSLFIGNCADKRRNMC